MTTAFSDFARQLLEQRQAAVTPLVEVGHPVGGIPSDEAANLVTDSVFDAIVTSLLDQVEETS